METDFENRFELYVSKKYSICVISFTFEASFRQLFSIIEILCLTWSFLCKIEVRFQSLPDSLPVETFSD